MREITSSDNPKLKYIRRLGNGRFRSREGRYVAEGARLVGDALAAGVAPEFTVIAQGFADHAANRPLQDALEAAGPTFLVPDGLFGSMADTVSPQGVLAVMTRPSLPVPSGIGLGVVLDGLHDPGNVGTILRTAAAAGAQVALLAPGCVDATNPKVVRAGMGAHFRLPLRELDWDGIDALRGGAPLVLADGGGEALYTDRDWRSPGLLVIGGEAHGVSETARARATASIRIPMANHSESINAAAAAAVILFEAARQRGFEAPSR